MLIEREQFLQHCAAQGMVRTTLTSLATELSVVAQRLEISGNGVPIGLHQIVVAAERWDRHQRCRGRSRGLRWPRERFVQVARDWLGFLHRLQACEPEPPAGAEWIEQFAAYMQEERGLSAATIHDSRQHMEKFFQWLAAQNRTLAEATITDVDAFLEPLGQRVWCRVSVVKGTRTLRAYFRYAERRVAGPLGCGGNARTGLGVQAGAHALDFFVAENHVGLKKNGAALRQTATLAGQLGYAEFPERGLRSAQGLTSGHRIARDVLSGI
jgi:hypothetical protein